MKAFLITGAAVAALAAASAAWAQAAPAGANWTAFGSDEEGDYSFDPASVARSGTNVSVRIRAVAREDWVRGFRSALLTNRIDCAAQTSTFTSIEVFDSAGAPIEPPVPPREPQPHRIFPGSPDAALYERLCPSELVRPILPPPVIRTTVAPPPMITAAPPPPPPIRYTAPPPPPPPPPQYRSRAQWAVPPSGLITDADYPAAALRNEEQGAVRVRLDVSREGRVTACTIIGSSGSSILDAATCRLFTMRGRFRPARDRRGRPAADRVVTSIIWRIPEDLPPEPAPGQPQSAEQS